MKIVKKEIINCVSIASHEILSQKRKQKSYNYNKMQYYHYDE